jgi:enterochelin esterase family protein
VTIPRSLGICLGAALITMVHLVFGQTAAAQQTAQPPGAAHGTSGAADARDPNTAGYLVAKKVLPLVELQAHVKLTKDPEGRATMGGQFRGLVRVDHGVLSPGVVPPVLTYSGTFVNQQWPWNPQNAGWGVGVSRASHSGKRGEADTNVDGSGGRDLFNPNVMRDNMHDWVLANELMARVLAAKGYHDQFGFARNAGPVDGQ